MKKRKKFKVGAIINRPHKSNNGITLIALVLTIIILLILAGVSLNLVAGSNGILNRAKVAVNATNLANIKEELELKIAEMQLDYYSDSSLQSTYSTVNTYVKAKFKEGIELSNGVDVTCEDDGKLNYDEVEIGILNPDGTITIDGEFNGGQIVAKYRVTYNANGGTGNVPATAKYDSGETVTVDFSTTPTRERYTFLGWATSSNATTPEYINSGSFEITKNTTLYAVWEELAIAKIKPSNYGDKVNYSANNVNDWQVFLNDGTNIYLISTNIVVSNGLNRLSNIYTNVDYIYTDYGNSSELVNWMTNTSYWTAYAAGFSGAVAYGGPTRSQLYESYNGVEGTSSSSGSQSLSGEPWVSGNRYWLASTYDSNGAFQVSTDGSVGGNYVSDYGGINNCDKGIRPLVKLPSDVKMTWDGNAWNLSK